MATSGNESDYPIGLNVSEIQHQGIIINGTSTPLTNIRMPNAYLKIAYGSVSVLGILGNFIVIVVIAKSATMRNIFTNILILNQSCIDLMAAVCIMLTTTRTSVAHDLSGILGEIYCIFWLSDLPLWSFLISSSYSLIMLTVERYVAVVHPIFHHNSVSKRTVLIMAAASWFAGLIDILALVVPTTGVIDGRCYVMTLFASPGWKKFCGVGLFITQYLIPITVFITCYSRIFVFLRSRISPQGQTSGNEVAVQKARASRNVLKTLVIIVVCYILCNSWNQFTFLAFNFGYAVDYNGWYYNFTVIAMFLNCCANPFIYALKYEIFQKEFRMLFFTCGAPMNSETST
ncbi:Somatostatin receptor type 2 [Lamellibrachia satsuma]|nr:Somatostatin receptor type 2 [Lamellibrachia satsuma]